MSRKSEALAALRELIASEGLLKAYRGLERVLDDPKSPPTALATAATSMLKAGGAFDSQVDDDVEKPGHEMTYQELQESIARLDRQLRGGAGEGGSDLFD